MNAEEAHAQVKEEVDNNMFIATDPRGFLDSLFPFGEVVEDILDDFIEEGIYDSEVGWTGVPDDRAPESAYNAWFADLAEKIVAKFLELEGITNEERIFLTRWIVNQKSAPSTLSHITSLIRPSISNVILSREEYESQSRTAESRKTLKDRYAGEHSIFIPEHDSNDLQEAVVIKARGTDKLPGAEATLHTKAGVWWSRTNVVVEIKKRLTMDLSQHIERLVGYVQNVFREQLDRRSALGLLFFGEELAVWHVDRSGIFGTRRAFNIYKSPRSFIQTILGCSVGEPAMLGYDTSMKLWLPSKADPLPAYHPDISPEHFCESVKKNWVISMPGSSTDPSNRTKFLTIDAISTVRVSNMISGRATVVWIAMKYEDIGKKDHKIYVLKQCWRPTDTPSEANFIPEGVPNITQVYSSEDVADEFGNQITTVEYLRHMPNNPISDPSFESKDAQAGRSEWPQEKCIMFTIRDHKIPLDIHPPISRIQTRLVMEHFGWPIHHFCDLLELLNILREVVQAQKDLYFNHRTLQRDISFANILIVPSELMEGSTHACLIDYDNASQADRHVPSVLGTLHAIGGSWELPEIEEERARIKAKTQWEIQEDLDRMLGIYIYYSGTYLLDFADLFDASRDKKLYASDLGFLAMDKTVPNFTSQTKESELNATIPFASCELLSIFGRKLLRPGHPRPHQDHQDRRSLQNQVFRGTNRYPLVCHDAEHDLEALHWLLTWICLTRSGPGGQRRLELYGNLNQPDSSPDTRKLHKLCQDLFLEDDLDKMSLTKKDILIGNSGAPYPPTFFGKYFKPLEGLWNQWRKIIVVAHMQPTFELIHDFFLKEIDVTIEEVAKINTERTPEEEKVRNERQKQLRRLKDFTATEGDLQVVTPHQAPIIPTGHSPVKAVNKSTSAREETGTEDTRAYKRQRTSARVDDGK